MGSFNLRLFIAAFFLSLSTQSICAQSGYEHDPDEYEYTEWHKNTGAESGLTALGSNLMGDSIDPHMGSLSFSQTDVSIPGNSSLEVAIRRTRSSGLAYKHNVQVEFGDWELSSPRIQAISLETPWSGDRCSDEYDVTLPDGTDVDFLTNSKYSNGVMVRTGGSSQQLLESPNGDQWPAGTTHVTTGNWYFTCLNNISGGGEGFLGHAPNGDVYRFDRFFTRNHYNLIGKYNKVRFQNIIAATQVTDVHGNTVSYNYDGLNRLTSITSNDQRTITLGYTGSSQLIRSVTVNGRKWAYKYAASTYSEDPFIEIVKENEAHAAVLRKVELPDYLEHNTAWEFDIDGMTASPGPGLLCQQQSRTLTITHPHGTVGTFVVQELQHRQDITRRERPLECPGVYRYGEVTGSQPDIFDPAANATMGVTRKTLSGTDFDDIVWTYQYEQDRSTRPTISGLPPYTNLPDWPERTNWTKVTAPDGQIMTYTHYWAGAAADGFPGDDPDLGNKIKQLTISSANGTVLRTTDYEYVTETGLGSTFARQFPSPASVVQPGYTVKTTILQDGDTYVSETDYITNQSASNYSFGNPTETRSWSNYVISNEAKKRIVETTYEHNTSKWILGLPKTVRRNGRLLSTKTYTDEGQIDKIYQYSQAQAVADYDYHQLGMIASVTDALGRVTLADYWKRGQPQRIVRALGTAVQELTSREVDDNGWVMSYTDPSDNKTTYTRDSMGRLERTTPHTPASEYKLVDTIINYDFTGGGAKQTIKKGPRHDIITYDSLFRPVLEETKDLGTGISTFVNTRYDGLGRTTYTSFPSASSTALQGTTTAYDGLGRVTETQETVSPFARTRHFYTNNHRSYVIDPEGNTTQTYRYGYDGPGQGDTYLIRQGEGIDTWTYRNVHGQVFRARQRGPIPTGGTLDKSQYFNYDSRQRLCRHKTIESGSTVYQYNDANELTAYQKGRNISGCTAPSGNDKVTLTYDGLGRPEATNFADSNTPDIWRDYDVNGNLTKLYRGAGSAAAKWDYSYDSYNRLTSEHLTIDNRAYDLNYYYNAHGYMYRVFLPTGKGIRYSLDGLGRHTKVKWFAETYAENASYHPSGAVAGFTYGNGQVFTQTLNQRLQPQRLLAQKGNTKALDLTYNYDLNGRISSQDNGVDSDNSRIYSYDRAGRLKTASSPSFGSGAGLFTYDALGNLRKKTMRSRTVTNSYDANNRLTASHDNATGVTRAVGYDNRGNVTTLGDLGFTYDRADQPITVSSSGVNATYTYDGNMKRVKAVSNGKTLYNVYDAAGRLVHVDEVTDNKETDYVHGMGQTLARIKNGTFTYLHPDHLGSPQAGTNEAGAVSFREHYTPFGETLTNPAANDNQSGFTGHIKDKDTGLNYMQARYYDPNIGRFLSVDPVTFTASGGNPGYFNRYSYTQNNPINATDPTGMASCFASRLSEGGSNCLGTSGGGQAGTSAEGAYNGSQTQVQAQAQPSPAPAPNSNPTTTPNPANDNTPRGANDNNKPPSLSGLLRLGSVVGALAYAEPIGNGELPEDKKNQFFFHYTDSSTAASIANSGVIMASGGKVYVTRAVLGADEVNNALFLGRRPNGGRGVVAFTAPPTFVTVPDPSIPIGEIHFGSIRHGRGGVHFNYVGKNNF